jgi:putative serine protease PepD
MTTGPSSPVVDKYRARTVAADGYLDLAVIQIYATASGKPINPASLHLPYLTIGNVAALQLDQNLTTLGFPGMSQSDSITVTSGVVDTFVPDPLKHVKDPRFELETTAKIGHGNSGGGAITDSGQLVGVPSLGVPGTGTDVSWRLRSVAEAKPLIAAARNHTAYHSTILVQRTGSESVTSSGVGATADAACAGGQTLASSASAVFGFNYSGFPSGLDYMAVIVAPDGTALRDEHQNPPQGTTTTNSGCLSFTVPAALYNQDTIPVGTYQIQLLVGPSLTPAGPAVAVHITAPAGGGSSNGAGN